MKTIKLPFRPRCTILFCRKFAVTARKTIGQCSGELVFVCTDCKLILESRDESGGKRATWYKLEIEK